METSATRVLLKWFGFERLVGYSWVTLTQVEVDLRVPDRDDTFKLTRLISCRCKSGQCPVWVVSAEDRVSIFGQDNTTRTKQNDVQCTFRLSVRDVEHERDVTFQTTMVLSWFSQPLN